jgi:hypothetical protein
MDGAPRGPPGSHFDRYVIEALLGQGGMGRVWVADVKVEAPR